VGVDAVMPRGMRDGMEQGDRLALVVLVILMVVVGLVLLLGELA
jgi:hypothetical protein